MGRVLFVDDHKDTADMLANIAVEMGHCASVAYDGITAIRVTSHEAFDLVFLDVSLPDADGREVCSQIRRGPSRHSRIVAVTGHAELRANAEMCGFDACILKPVTMQQLEDVLTVM